MSAGVIVPPRPDLEPDDLVTPAQAARKFGVPLATMRSWIRRSEQIIGRKVEPLGHLGRWPAYDYDDLAELDAQLRRNRESRVSSEAALARRPRPGPAPRWWRPGRAWSPSASPPRFRGPSFPRAAPDTAVT